MKAYKKILKWITIIKLGTISLVVLVIFSTIGGLVSTNKKVQAVTLIFQQ